MTMPPEFIFMLTRHDRTIAEAKARLGEVLELGVRHVGAKDIGLPFDELRHLADMARAAGATFYLEVVSLDEASETASAHAALRLGADVLMGGTRPHAVLPVIAGAPIRYFPFAGQISGHPSVLEGPLEAIVESARRLTALEGVDGLDLLAYRFAGDAAGLIRAVCRSVGKPVVVAGSIDRAERIAAVVAGGAAGFTIGTAALDGVFPAGPDLCDQIRHVQALLAAAG
jgi:hypothetical protein